MGADTFRKMSTSFSWMLGSVVMNWFLSPAKSIKESRRTLSERDRISYSRLVNIVEEGVVVTLATMQYMENPASSHQNWTLTQEFWKGSLVCLKQSRHNWFPLYSRIGVTAK
jgi:hypothetical protein